MISVLEVTKLNTNTHVLICDRFSDDVVTGCVRINNRLFERFEVERVRECFSVAKTRDIVVFTDENLSNIKEVEFV